MEGLELILAFVNTVDLEEGREELDSAAALGQWLAVHGLVSESSVVRQPLDQLPAQHSCRAQDQNPHGVGA